MVLTTGKGKKSQVSLADYFIYRSTSLLSNLFRSTAMYMSVDGSKHFIAV